MKRKLVALWICVALMAMVLVPVQGTFAVEEVTPAPATEAPATEAPATEAPATEVPATEVPATEVPATEVPATETPATEAPATEVPATEVPATEVPATEVPATEAPATEPPAAEEPAAALAASLELGARSAFAGKEVGVTAKISGGAAPYALSLEVSHDGRALGAISADLDAAGEQGFSFNPEEFGIHEFTLTVIDAEGNVALAEARLPVAVHESESDAQWEKTMRGVKLTGDWRQDLLAIARTQLGYEESESDFIIDEDGVRQGYTRYGDWGHAPYAEWCALFVSFALHYAEIPEADFPRDSNCADWRDALERLDAYRDPGDYEPKPGDLIFFNWEGKSAPQHVGIVEEVSEGKVNTIEGNAAGGVRQRGYRLSDGAIVGYGEIGALMARAGVADPLAPAEPENTLEPEDTPAPDTIEEPEAGAPQIARTNADGVNLRQEPNIDSEKIGRVELAETPVTVLEAHEIDGEIWYLVEYEGLTGYIRGDLLVLEVAPEEVPEPEQGEPLLVEILEQPRGGLWQFGQAEAALRFEVAWAESYRWQRGIEGETGEIIWEDIEGATLPEALIAVDLEALTYAYRALAVDAEGVETLSDAVTLIRPDLVAWLRAGGVSWEMLERAMGAAGLESLVFEGEKVVHVRTGDVVARYDAETGAVVDAHYGLIVAYLEDGVVRPVAAAEADAPDAN